MGITLCAVCLLCWQPLLEHLSLLGALMSRAHWHTLWGARNFRETKWGGWGRSGAKIWFSVCVY